MSALTVLTTIISVRFRTLHGAISASPANLVASAAVMECVDPGVTDGMPNCAHCLIDEMHNSSATQCDLPHEPLQLQIESATLGHAHSKCQDSSIVFSFLVFCAFEQTSRLCPVAFCVRSSNFVSEV